MGYIYSLVHNLQDTEDLYQQSCVLMWQKFGDFQQDTDFARWACSISHYVVANYLRQRRSQRRCFSEEFLADYARWEQDRKAEVPESYSSALDDCIDKLSKFDQQFIKERYCSGEPIKEIAKRYNRSPQSLCNSLGRIRAALLKCVERTLLAEGRS
jgi:RNA polymerase sigma-70 factor (ECF subfamily)